jgi:hypothetical protein
MRPDSDPYPTPSFTHVEKSEIFVNSQKCIFIVIVTSVIFFNILDSTYIEIFWEKYSLALHFAEAGSGSYWQALDTPRQIRIRQNNAVPTGSGTTTLCLSRDTCKEIL